MKEKYWTRAHTKHRLMYHLVWIPKYRKRILKGAIAIRLKELFEQCAELNGWEIQELNIQIDHVHILVQLKSNVSPSYAVRLFKDVVSLTNLIIPRSLQLLIKFVLSRKMICVT